MKSRCGKLMQKVFLFIVYTNTYHSMLISFFFFLYATLIKYITSKVWAQIILRCRGYCEISFSVCRSLFCSLIVPYMHFHTAQRKVFPYILYFASENSLFHATNPRLNENEMWMGKVFFYSSLFSQQLSCEECEQAEYF